MLDIWHVSGLGVLVKLIGPNVRVARNPGLARLHEQHVLAVIDVHEKENPMSEMSRLARFSGTLLLIVGGRAALGSPPQTASPSPATTERITIL
jgi:hypothetical protein